MLVPYLRKGVHDVRSLQIIVPLLALSGGILLVSGLLRLLRRKGRAYSPGAILANEHEDYLGI